MKYKVGDKVRIKSLDWYNANKNENLYIDCGDICFGLLNKPFCGEVLTIKEIEEHYYTVEENEIFWTDEMIEGLVEEETKPKMVNLDDVCNWVENHIFDFPWYDNEQSDFSSKDVANALRKAMEE